MSPPLKQCRFPRHELAWTYNIHTFLEMTAVRQVKMIGQARPGVRFDSGPSHPPLEKLFKEIAPQMICSAAQIDLKLIHSLHVNWQVLPSRHRLERHPAQRDWGRLQGFETV